MVLILTVSNEDTTRVQMSWGTDTYESPSLPPTSHRSRKGWHNFPLNIYMHYSKLQIHQLLTISVRGEDKWHHHWYQKTPLGLMRAQSLQCFCG